MEKEKERDIKLKQIVKILNELGYNTHTIGSETKDFGVGVSRETLTIIASKIIYHELS